MTRTITKEIDYENPWTFNNKPFTSDDIKSYVGFVYLITEIDTDKKYIGRKYFYQLRKKKGKSKRVKSESDWKKYYGSSDELKRDIKENGRDTFKREILSLHTTLGKVNYEETKQLFLHNVLMEALDDGTPMYYNSNILGRYMRKDYGQFYEKSKDDI